MGCKAGIGTEGSTREQDVAEHHDRLWSQVTICHYFYDCAGPMVKKKAEVKLCLQSQALSKVLVSEWEEQHGMKW